ncbi:MAG: ATP-dependent helicase [Spirochaetales bacterium]|nr:ATP-dependent helicase [Spirochaetales bacterium]
MEKKQTVSQHINKEEKGYFVQNDLFQYWTPGAGTKEQVLYTTSPGPITEYVSQTYDIFYDLSPEFHEEELEFLHTDDVGIALVGGAGTGKTQVISSLAGYWLREGIFQADEVLVITFTDPETRELTPDILKTAGQKGTGVEVTGIDWFCFKILCAAYKIAPRVFQEHDRKFFISLFFPFLSEKTVESLCSYIDSKEMNKENEQEEDLPHLYETYIDSLIRTKTCDKGTLAVQAAQALTGNPRILFTMQQKYRCILIDDLQCMDKHQYDILSRIIMHNILLETPPGRIQKIVVSVDPLQREKRTHKKSVCEMFLSNYIRRRFFLNKSWRVPGKILSSVSRLYTGEKIKKKKVPKTHKKQGTPIFFYRAKDSREEAVFIKETILSLVEKKRAYPSDEYTWKDFGIFTRKEETLKEIAPFLAQVHIPFIEYEKKSFTGTGPFRRINSLFHFMLSEKDVAAFADILLNLFYDFSIGQVKSIFLAGNRKDEPLSGLVLRLYNEQILSDSQYSGIVKLFKIKEKARKTVSESGITEGIASLYSGFPGLEQSLMNFPEEKQLYMEYAEFCGKDVRKFVTEPLFIGTNHRDIKERVYLSTFHHAKGLELPVIFIPAMEEGNCPFYDTSPDIEAETGLFYSAITRVKERVYLSCTETRSGKKQEVSSFIKEMGSHIKEISPASPERFKQGALF